jgi:hypothetical protein
MSSTEKRPRLYITISSAVGVASELARRIAMGNASNKVAALQEKNVVHPLVERLVAGLAIYSQSWTGDFWLVYKNNHIVVSCFACHGEHYFSSSERYGTRCAVSSTRCSCISLQGQPSAHSVCFPATRRSTSLPHAADCPELVPLLKRLAPGVCAQVLGPAGLADHCV